MACYHRAAIRGISATKPNTVRAPRCAGRIARLDINDMRERRLKVIRSCHAASGENPLLVLLILSALSTVIVGLSPPRTAGHGGCGSNILVHPYNTARGRRTLCRACGHWEGLLTYVRLTLQCCHGLYLHFSANRVRLSVTCQLSQRQAHLAIPFNQLSLNLALVTFMYQKVPKSQGMAHIRLPDIGTPGCCLAALACNAHVNTACSNSLLLPELALLRYMSASK